MGELEDIGPDYGSVFPTLFCLFSCVFLFSAYFIFMAFCNVIQFANAFGESAVSIYSILISFETFKFAQIPLR